MKAAELRDLESEDLYLRLGELKEELFNLRFQLATGQLDNHARLKLVRQDIARIRTVLRERDFEAFKEQEQLATSRTPAGGREPVAAAATAEEDES